MASDGADFAASADWFDEPMRWLQLNLVPDDVVHADIAAWQRYWRDAKVDGLTLSAAGATAFYPTAVPFHHRSEYLGERDFLGELVAAAKELDLRVLARFEPNVMSAELATAHPDWVVQRAQATSGAPVDRTLQDALRAFTGGRPTPCSSSPFYWSFVPEVMTELATRYPIDGFYANGWPQIGSSPILPGTACSCTYCRESWRARGHDEYPMQVDVDDPRWIDFVTWIQERYEQLQAMWQAHAKAIRPGLSFVCNLHGALTSGLRWDAFLRHVDLFANDAQARQWVGGGAPGVGAHALWNQACSAALLRAAVGDRPTFHIVGAWHAGYSLRRLAKEPVELRMMLAQVVARGARPWCNVAGGTIYDRRWMQPVTEYYQWHAEHEPFLRNRGSLADVGLVWSPSSMARSTGAPGPDPVAAFMGWYEALLATRAVSDVVMDDKLGALDLSRYQVLVVPSGVALDAGTAHALERFVAAGGGLVLGCGTLAPAAGNRGGEATLAGVAGVEAPSAPEGPRPNGYLDVRAAPPNALLEGLGDTDYLPAGDWLAAPHALVGASGTARYQHPLPFLADLAVVVDPPPDEPVLTSSGRCVYLGTDLDALHARHQLGDTGRLLANALRVARAGRTAAVEVDGPGMFDVQAWEQAASRTVHLVNLTNPRLYGGPVEELVTVGPLTIRIHVDATIPVTGVRLLRSGDRAAWDRADGTVTVTVPAITDFEVVALELDSD